MAVSQNRPKTVLEAPVVDFFSGFNPYSNGLEWILSKTLQQRQQKWQKLIALRARMQLQDGQEFRRYPTSGS